MSADSIGSTATAASDFTSGISARSARSVHVAAPLVPRCPTTTIASVTGPRSRRAMLIEVVRRVAQHRMHPGAVEPAAVIRNPAAVGNALRARVRIGRAGPADAMRVLAAAPAAGRFAQGVVDADAVVPADVRDVVAALETHFFV